VRSWENMWRAVLMAALIVAAPVAGTESPLGTSGAAAGSGGMGGNGREFVPTCRFRHQDASVVLREASNRMDVLINITLVTARQTSHLFVTLNPAMDVGSVRDLSTGELSYQNLYGSVLNVSLGRTVPADTGLVLGLAYGGKVLNSPDGGTTYWDYIGTEGSWVRTYGWFFPYDEERTRTTSRMAITVPADELAVAPGNAVGNVSDTANGTVSYIYENPRPSNGLSFVAGHLVRTTIMKGQTRYDVFFASRHAGSAPSYVAELDRINGFYSSLLGPAGFGNLTVVEVPDMFAAWGQTVPSMLWLASRNFAGPFPYRLLAHELGHQWWGIDVQGRLFHDNWIQEGFAGYIEALYEMEVYGSRGYLDYCRTQYINQFVQSADPEPALSGNSYDLAASKGPWVLHMLRYILGDALFDRTLLDFHQNFSGLQVGVEDFERSSFSSTGRHLDDFFDFWLNGSGRLDIACAGAVVYRGPGAQDRLQLALERRGGPASTVADVGFYDAEGHLTDLLPGAYNASAPCATVRFDIDHWVDAVVLDPDEWLLDSYPSNNEVPTRGASLDIWVSGISLSQPRPWDNESFTVNASLASASSEGPNGAVVELRVDGLAAGNGSATITAAGKAWVEFACSLAAGSHRLDILLDPAGDIFETDRTNNDASVNITVVKRPAELPDLRILPGGFGFSPETASGDDPVRLTALVENNGGALAQNVTVSFWVDAEDTGYVGSFGGLAIQPGQTAAAWVNWTALAGRHELSARAAAADGEDDNASDNEASGMIYVNARPTAILGCSDQEPLAGEWVDFSGATSSDDGTVAHYFFDFGDGELAGWLPDAATSHLYLSKGVYKARLKVVDDQGAGSDWSPGLTVKVTEGPPVAVISAGPASGNVRTMFSFGSLSHDGEGSIACETWSFGDGRYAQGVRVDHLYASHGDFTVTLTVEDFSGRSARATTVIRVLDLPPMPAISLPRSSARVGENMEFRAGGSSDPDDPPGALSYLWDFGDGQNALGPNASYAFRRPGNYRVVLTVSDGNLSAEMAVEVVVRWAPPPSTGKPGANWFSWTVLGALLCAMALLVVSMMIPDDRARKHEEEE
jgi:PKD repeat protein